MAERTQFLLSNYRSILKSFRAFVVTVFAERGGISHCQLSSKDQASDYKCCLHAWGESGDDIERLQRTLVHLDVCKGDGFQIKPCFAHYS
jgi:hypothetical protein